MPTDTPNLKGVTPLFVAEFFDVSLRGICRHQGETLFFTLVSDPTEDDQPLEYAVFRLPKEQTDYFLWEKDEFERLVGTEWSYSEDRPFQRIGGWSGRGDWQTFYGRARRFVLSEELARDTAQLIGHFIWPE